MANLELYRVFYTVAKCGSLTKAAEQLYISQPAVSQSIKQLENQLGVSLFNRNHKGMELSAQGGKLIFARVEEALRLFDESEALLTQMKTSATGNIRIGASDTIFEYFLADKIVEFHEKFPAIKIELISGITPETIDDLKTEKCDVAFVNLPIEVDEDLILKGNCMRLNDVFVAGEKFKELSEKTQPISALKGYPLIMLDEKTVARRSLDHYLKNLGVTLTPSIEIESWDLMKRLATRGMGIGVIPREYATKAIERGELFEIKTDPALPPRSVGMLLPKNRTSPFALRAFLQLFDLEI
ncbi:MAG: LysR family transcriptional regulator [Clostridia bacterium]|nr:LysR family transcriptional regulator [Clostridia bacterium]